LLTNAGFKRGASFRCVRISRRAKHDRRIECRKSRFDYWLKTCTATQVRTECRPDLRFIGRAASSESNEPGKDAWRTKATLTRTSGFKRRYQSLKESFVKPAQCGDRFSSHSSRRSDAGNACNTVNQYRAATALALWTTPVLERLNTALVSERVKKISFCRNRY